MANALAVLETFSPERREIGVTDLSRALGLGKSTVHRLLATLGARGYVRQDAQTDRYRLGLKAFEIGALAVGQLTMREAVAPSLRSLGAASRETVHLGVLDGWDVVYIDKIESPQTLQMYSRVGRRAPVHATALGKALLAFQPEREAERFLRRRLRVYTAMTLTDPVKIRHELDRIRMTGVAVDNEEFEIGLKCVAGPIRDHTGQVVASLGIAAPAVRLPAARLTLAAEMVRDAVRAATAALGFRERP